MRDSDVLLPKSVNRFLDFQGFLIKTKIIEDLAHAARAPNLL